MKEKIFTACFLGALIGALTSIQLGFGWFGGGFVGFIVGYLAFDFKRVIATTKVVAANVYNDVTNWKPDRQRWIIVRYIVFIGRAGFTLTSPAMCIAGFIKGTEWGEILISVLLANFLWVFAISIVTIPPESTEGLETMIRNIPVQNPITFWFWRVPKWIISMLAKIAAFIVSVVSRIPKFLVTVIRLIHSDVRLLCCGTDAAIGAVVGSIFASPIVGAIVGGVLGVVNYELVSKRLLKIAV